MDHSAQKVLMEGYLPLNYLQPPLRVGERIMAFQDRNNPHSQTWVAAIHRFIGQQPTSPFDPLFIEAEMQYPQAIPPNDMMWFPIRWIVRAPDDPEADRFAPVPGETTKEKSVRERHYHGKQINCKHK